MAKKFRNFQVVEGPNPKQNARFPVVYFPQVQIMEDGEWLGIKPKRAEGNADLTYSFVSAEEGTFSLNPEAAQETIGIVKKLNV